MTNKKVRMQFCRLVIRYDFYLFMYEDKTRVYIFSRRSGDETIEKLIRKGYLLKAGIIKPKDDNNDYAILYIYDNRLDKEPSLYITDITLSVNEDEIPFYENLSIIMKCRSCMSSNQIAEAIDNISS